MKLNQNLDSVSQNIMCKRYSIVSMFFNFVWDIWTSLPVITLNIIYRYIIIFSLLPHFPLIAALYIAYYNNLMIIYREIKLKGKLDKYTNVKLIISMAMTLAIFYLGLSLFKEILSLISFTLGIELISYYFFYYSFLCLYQLISDYWCYMYNWGQGGNFHTGGGVPGGGTPNPGGGPPGGGNQFIPPPDPNTVRPTYHPVGSQVEPISLERRVNLRNVSPGWKEIPSGFMLVSIDRTHDPSGSRRVVKCVSCLIPRCFEQAGPYFVYSPNNHAVNHYLAEMLIAYKSGISQTISRKVVGDDVWRYLQSVREYRGQPAYGDNEQPAVISERLLNAIRSRDENNN